jgi:hypothetical protein
LIPYLEKSKSQFPATAIEVVEGCVSDRPGTYRLQIDSQSTGHSHVDSDGTIAQENIVLDDYLERNGIEVVTFLKMDLEGQELILQRYDILPEQIFHFLYGNGFRIFYRQDRDLIGQIRETENYGDGYRPPR